MDALLEEVVLPPPTETSDIVLIDPRETLLETPLEKKIQVLGFRVSVINIVLFNSARLAIYLNCKTEAASFIDYKEIVIEGDEYSAWKDDDNYIMTLVQGKLASLIQ